MANDLTIDVKMSLDELVNYILSQTITIVNRKHGIKITTLGEDTPKYHQIRKDFQALIERHIERNKRKG